MLLKIFSVFAYLLATCTISYAQDDKVVASVNGKKIHESDIARNLTEIQGFENFAIEQQTLIKSKVLDSLTAIMAVAHEAERLEIAESEEFKKNLEDFRNQLLYTTLIEKHIENFITDAKIKKYYDSHKKMFLENKASASHILVKSSDEAVSIIKKLNNGDDFEKLAREFSIGPSSKNNGDLGWFNKDDMVEEFSEAAFKLEKGKYTKKPVRTQFGWHIIKLNDKISDTPKLLKDVKETIKEELMQQEVESYMDSIMKKADVIIHEK